VDAETSSADPRALFAYAEVCLRIDARLEASAARLAAVLDQFAATCREYPLGIDGRVADPMRAHAHRMREHALWVRSVAEQFMAADAGVVQEPALAIVRDEATTGQEDDLAALLQAVLGLLPSDLAALVMGLFDAGDAQDALILAGLLPAGTDDADAADAANAPPDGLGTLGEAALGLLGQAKDAAGDELQALAGALPAFPMAELDPNGPIARQARGEPINPFEWSGEVAQYEARTALAAAPDEVRNAQVTLTLPGVGEQTLSTEALIALAADPSNLVGIGPVEGRTASILEKAVPYVEGPAKAAVSRLLRGIAPELADRIVGDAAKVATRTGLSERVIQRSMLRAIESSEAAAAVGGKIDYGAIDELGRPTGIRATITQGMTAEGFGTSADGEIIPLGYVPQKPPLARGHLLGKQLGGSGDVYENLVTLYQNPTNTPLMSKIEGQVRLAVDAGQTVEYEAIPIYEGQALKPARVRIRARGSNGLDIDVTIENAPKPSPVVDPALGPAPSDGLVAP
jgi:hypothetical protein